VLQLLTTDAMVRHAARAVPWTRICLAAALAVVLMELVRWNPWVLWPLEGTAVGLLCGATAWCFDEPAAALVDTAPRGPAWRAAARTPAIALLLGVWTATVFHAGDHALFGHRDAVLVQGLAAQAAGAALATWSRSRGAAAPGTRIAMVVVPVTTAVALTRPLARAVPVFPYLTSSGSAWDASTTGWVLVAVLAGAVVTAALSENARLMLARSRSACEVSPAPAGPIRRLP
jgi:hypothetical protein